MSKWIHWIFPLIWMGVIFHSSSQPYQEQDIKPFLSNIIDLSFLDRYLNWIKFTYHQSEVSVASLGVNGLLEFFIRKGAHVTVFLVLMILLYFAFIKTVSMSKNELLIISLFITIAYAVFDEIHQGFTPNRTPFFGDVLLDTFGAIIGLGIILLIRFKRNSN
ncbi:VanZ family protein [Aquibacillus halophilus]|uniref:VanZ family protein n=1 Tax=Aquibacillus halophilus TaxID=930132 RepID=A0A6A8D9L0_9BACI|nr:VanZ family protein [Aquibacillus halophilus]MRH41960.1 VanZ family protein [Aquibacillus halophilus]